MALTRNIPAKNVTFRNRGWSGDTVWAESRGIFEPADQGYAQLIELVKEQKPSVLIFGYGAVEAFDGPPRRTDSTDANPTARTADEHSTEHHPLRSATAPTIDWSTDSQKITLAIDRDAAGDGNAPLSLRVEFPAESGL